MTISISSKQTIVILSVFVLAFGIISFSCDNYPSPGPSPSPTISTNISSSLQLQLNLRKAQLTSPLPERLAQMQAQGMNVSNLNIQRIYIYLKQPLTPSQTSDLQSIGITVHLDSWMPPVGNNPEGFYLAEMPVDKLDALTAKDYITKLDTAEKQLQLQSDLK